MPPTEGLSDSPQGIEPTSRTTSRRLPVNGLAPSLERRRLRIYLLLVLCDAAILLNVFAISKELYLGDLRMPGVILSAILMVPLYLTIALHNATYSLPSITDWKTGASRAISALLISAVLLNFFAFFAKMNEEFSRVVFALGLIGTIALILVSRIAVERWVKRLWGPSARNCLVIEAGGPPLSIEHVYRVDAARHGLLPTMDNPDALDRLAHYLRNMDEVVVSCRDEDRASWAEVLKGSGVRGEIVSSYARDIGAIGLVRRDRADLTTFLVSLGPLGMRARVAKRLFDVSLSAASLLLLSPLFLAIAMAIVLEDGGPILFKQRRMGRGNRFFMIYKFRSMSVSGSDADGVRSAAPGDERITRVGRFIRRTSLDELPQLLNVLRGDMSTVDFGLSAPKSDPSVCRGAAGGDAGGARKADPMTGKRKTVGMLAWMASLVLVGVVTVFAQLDRHARIEPATAVIVPAAFRGFSQQHLSVDAIVAGDAERSVELTRQLLRRRPLPAENVTLFGQAATVAGDNETAVRALILSAGRGWREPIAQEIAAEVALADGDYSVAADRVAMLWIVADERERLADLSTRLLASPEGMEAMARRYVQEGRWQGEFLRGTFNGREDRDKRQAFLALVESL